MLGLIIADLSLPCLQGAMHAGTCESVVDGKAGATSDCLLDRSALLLDKWLTAQLKSDPGALANCGCMMRLKDD